MTTRRKTLSESDARGTAVKNAQEALHLLQTAISNWTSVQTGDPKLIAPNDLESLEAILADLSRKADDARGSLRMLWVTRP